MSNHSPAKGWPCMSDVVMHLLKAAGLGRALVLRSGADVAGSTVASLGQPLDRTVAAASSSIDTTPEILSTAQGCRWSTPGRAWTLRFTASVAGSTKDRLGLPSERTMVLVALS